MTSRCERKEKIMKNMGALLLDSSVTTIIFQGHKILVKNKPKLQPKQFDIILHTLYPCLPAHTFHTR